MINVGMIFDNRGGGRSGTSLRTRVDIYEFTGLTIQLYYLRPTSILREVTTEQLLEVGQS